MVIFDLTCGNGHQFEGWFDSLEDLESQAAKSLLSCPVCGAADVVRRPSTFGLVRSRPAEAPSQGPRGEEDPSGEAMEAFERLRALSAALERDFVDVGQSFSAEALKMHYGVAPRRNIRGLSTSDEERVLEREGVEFFKVPMLSRKTRASS